MIDCGTWIDSAANLTWRHLEDATTGKNDSLQSKRNPILPDLIACGLVMAVVLALMLAQIWRPM